MEPFRVGTNGSRSPIGVLVNPSGECEPQILQIQAWAREIGHDVVDLGTSAAPSDLAPGCELVIALGGDGTILRALQLAMAHHAAVLGVNFGTVGFLADIDGDDLGPALDKITRGEAKVDTRTALVATMHDAPDRPRHRVQRRRHRPDPGAWDRAAARRGRRPADARAGR